QAAVEDRSGDPNAAPPAPIAENADPNAVPPAPVADAAPDSPDTAAAHQVATAPVPPPPTETEVPAGMNNSGASTPAPAPIAEASGAYTVKDGDTLMKIAFENY